jgi:tetratricopeptide (TPR) repeat protein
MLALRSVLLFGLLLALAGCTSVTASQQAALLADKGQTAAAVQLLEQHLRRHPTSITERRLLVRLLGSAGRLADAARQAGTLDRQLGGNSPLPWIDLGHAQELAHRYDAALELYDRAARVAPRDALGPRTGGMRAAHWGELELAEPRLAEAARRDPRDPETWHVLGLVRVHLGELDAAAHAYWAGLRADPRAIQNRVGLATIALLRDDPRSALSQYDAILQTKPSYADAELGRSWALLQLGRLDEAQRALDHAEARGAATGPIQRQRELLNAARARVRSR